MSMIIFHLWCFFSPLLSPFSWVGLLERFVCTMCHKACYHRIYTSGVSVLLFYVPNPLPFVDCEPTPNTSWDGGHQKFEHLMVYLSWDYFQGGNCLVYWFGLICWVCNELCIWYVQINILDIIQISYIRHPCTYNHEVFFP